MTPTEELLAEALTDAAGKIRADSITPLREPGLSGQTAAPRRALRPPLDLLPRRAAWRSSRGIRPLVTLAAAASVLAVIGLVIAVGERIPLASPRAKQLPFADVGTVGSPPPYFVTGDSDDGLVVRSTATSAVTATTKALIGPSWMRAIWTIAAAANGRVFVAAASFNETQGDTVILYRFSLTAAGKITGLMRVSGDYFKANPCASSPDRPRCLPVLPWLSNISVAISADGSHIAIAGERDSAPLIASYNLPYIVVVEDVPAHTVRTWQFPSRIADREAIQDVSWASAGSVQFLADTCVPGQTVFTIHCLGNISRADPVRAQEWTLPVLPSGVLGSGHLVLTLPGVTVQAQSSRGAVTALTLHPGGISVARYAVPSGKVEQILYQGPVSATMCECRASWQTSVGENLNPVMTIDATGEYLLVSEKELGWIHNGVLHQLSLALLYGASSAAW